MQDRNSLRRRLRQQRAALSRQQVAHASLMASSHLIKLSPFRRAKRIAAYIAANGELDPLPVLLHASSARKACYLPRLHPFLKGRMWFLRWRPGDALQVNRFGIPEPQLRRGNIIPAWMLDWVMVPLVGFDAQMNRLGMGQGFYDRRFAFRHHRKVWKRPVLCGFAHDFQETHGLQSHHWDVPLDMVVTDHRIVTAAR
jgi:5-formyltetrahydrofolate cyclo-ligase